MLSSQLIHLLTLFDKFGPQLIFDHSISLQLLSQLLQYLAKITSAQIEQLHKLLIDTSLISTTTLEGTSGHFVSDLVEKLLLKSFDLAF